MDHPDFARYQWELASALASRGEVEEAERLFRRALDLQRRSRPPRDPDVAATLTSLGTLLLDRGESLVAEPFLREAVDIYVEALPVGNPTRIEAEQVLARCLSANRRP